MPNFFSAFTSEVFRPIATIIIPGAIAISTWFIGLLWHFPTFKDLVSHNHTEATLLMLLAMIFAGLVVEDAGAHIESHLDDWRDKQNGNHNDNWFKYLRTSFRADPIGRRYLRTLVLRLKFELGVACSMLCALAGLFWLGWMGLPCRVVFVNAIVCLLFTAWGVWEAVDTHEVLAANRANLLEDIRIIGQ